MNNRITMESQYSEYSYYFSTQREREYESTNEMTTSLNGSPRRSDGVDGTEDANRTLILVTHRTTGRGGQASLGSIRTHSLRIRNSRRVANDER